MLSRRTGTLFPADSLVDPEPFVDRLRAFPDRARSRLGLHDVAVGVLASPDGRVAPIWLAGAGVKGGHVHGETDDFSYNIVRDPVHIHDLNATILHLLGIDHEKLTVRHNGIDRRLTDVHGHVIREIIT